MSNNINDALARGKRQQELEREAQLLFRRWLTDHSLPQRLVDVRLRILVDFLNDMEWKGFVTNRSLEPRGNKFVYSFQISGIHNRSGAQIALLEGYLELYPAVEDLALVYHVSGNVDVYSYDFRNVPQYDRHRLPNYKLLSMIQYYVINKPLRQVSEGKIDPVREVLSLPEPVMVVEESAWNSLRKALGRIFFGNSDPTS